MTLDITKTKHSDLDPNRGSLNRRTFLTASAAAAAAPLAMAGNAVAQARPTPTGSVRNFQYARPGQATPYAWFIDGDQRSLTTDSPQFRGKPIVMVFWQQQCGICRIDMPRLNAAYETLTAKGIEVVPMTIGPEKLTSQIKSHYGQMGYDKLPIYADAAAEMQQGYGVAGTPTWFIINRSAQVVGWIEAPVNWLDRDAAALLSAVI